jgi:hypothetical protein
MAHFDDEHLKWVIASRAKNQTASLRLLTILHKYPEAKLDFNLVIMQALTAVAFSLWRAVFLTDKIGKAADHLEMFLEKLVVDNAIGYSQDRNSRDWTWPYYMNNAHFHLNDLRAKVWPEVPFTDADPNRPQDGWNSLHAALSWGIDKFERDLRKNKKKKKK